MNVAYFRHFICIQVIHHEYGDITRCLLHTGADREKCREMEEYENYWY